MKPCVTSRGPPGPSELDRCAEGMKLVWADDFGLRSDYAVEESPGVIRHIREAAIALEGAFASPGRSSKRSLGTNAHP